MLEARAGRGSLMYERALILPVTFLELEFFRVLSALRDFSTQQH